MKRINQLVFLLVLVSIFPFSLVTSALDKGSASRLISQSTEGETNLKFGMITDAPPVSAVYTDEFGQEYRSGYCEFLRSDLDKKYDIEVIKIPYDKRFQRFQGIDVECGQNSITKKREEDLKALKGKFSNSFFDTYTTLLINKSKLDNFKKNSSFNKIGFIANTTNARIKDIYTNTKEKNWIEVEGRGDAINKLKDGTIDAFANDEILLRSVQKEVDKWQRKYSIFPKNSVGFGFETYGVVVYDDDILWTNINNWIKGEDGLAAANKTLRN